MSWFRTKPAQPPVPLPAATFSQPPETIFSVLPTGPFLPIPEPLEDMLRRIVREELARRFGPLSE